MADAKADVPEIADEAAGPSGTVEEGARSPMGEASPVPSVFFWALWIPAFFVVLWGMMLLFRPRGAPPSAEKKPHPGSDSED